MIEFLHRIMNTKNNEESEQVNVYTFFFYHFKIKMILFYRTLYRMMAL